MPAVKGVRSVEMEVAHVERAAQFYTRVWGLAEVERRGGSVYLRGTGRFHHVLALHPARSAPAFRRMVFDGGDRKTVAALHEQVAKALGKRSAVPAPLTWPGGGWGFAFRDAQVRNIAIVGDVADHADTADVADRPRKIAHVNVNSADHAACARFFCDALGFRVIDETPGLLFMNCDSTDHNSIVISKETRNTVNHVAFEVPDIDSVMRGAGRMKDNGYPLEWGIGRHGAGNNVFAYFAGPEEFPIELTGEVLQIDASYVPRGPDHWKFPPGRADQWGVTAPHTPRWKRIQDMFAFSTQGDQAL